MRIIKKFQGTVPENKIMNTYSSSQTDTYSCNYVNWVTKKRIIKVRATQNQTISQVDTMNVTFNTTDINIGNAFELKNGFVHVIDPNVHHVRITATLWIERFNGSYAWCHLNTAKNDLSSKQEISSFMLDSSVTGSPWSSIILDIVAPINSDNRTYVFPSIYFNVANANNGVRGGTYPNSVYMTVEALD